MTVDLEKLHERVAEYGPVAFLVTVGGDDRPHVVSVPVELDGAAVVAGAGSTTSANAGAHPSVSLVWPAAPGGDYCLIVDGPARVGDGRLVVDPVRAVLHRIAGAPADLPSCVTILDRRPGH